MKNSLPLVSFVIPTHNRADLLKECLDSVLNQTYSNFEVVVINDNSKDDTEQVLQEYCTRYKNLSYFNNNARGGNAARNMGILKAKGEYIAFMDDDDICEPYRIEEQLRPVLSNSTEYNFVISGYKLLNLEGVVTDNVNYLKPLDSIGFPQRWLVKKEILLKTNLFDPEQTALQDVEFFWRIKEFANIIFSNKPVVNIRFTPISITKDTAKMIDGISRLLNLHANKMKEFERCIWLFTLCKKLALAGRWETYDKYYLMLNRLHFPFTTFSLALSRMFKSTLPITVLSRFYNIYYRHRNHNHSITLYNFSD